MRPRTAKAMTKPILSHEAISAQTNSRFSVLVEREVSSTNTILRAMADRGAPAGLVLFAEHQTAGRGRRGRTFFSPQQGLYCSLLLRPGGQAASALTVTTTAAVAVCRALAAFTDVPLAIKWVNDIYCRDRKIAGILTEAVTGGRGEVDCLILGIGINLVHPREGFPPELRDKAASLFDAAPYTGFPNAVAARLLDELDHALFADDPDAILAEYRRRSWLTGRTVVVQQGDNSFHARVLSIEDDYALRVLAESGKTVLLNSGEVSIQKE